MVFHAPARDVESFSLTPVAHSRWTRYIIKHIEHLQHTQKIIASSPQSAKNLQKVARGAGELWIEKATGRPRCARETRHTTPRVSPRERAMFRIVCTRIQLKVRPRSRALARVAPPPLVVAARAVLLPNARTSSPRILRARGARDVERRGCTRRSD